jgi:hypothetical protein
MLLASAKYNAKYCSRYGIDYMLHMGLKIGCHPHHAMFNRIYLLRDLVRQGYDGWVIYLDADNIIQKPDFNLKLHLAEAERDGKVFYFLNHNNESNANYSLWDINSGVFALKIGHETVNLLISLWAEFYEDAYSANNYIKFTRWGDMINDQSSLQIILAGLDQAIGLKELCCFSDFSQHIFAWFGRTEEDPSSGDIQSRVDRLVAAGDAVYFNKNSD